jgi:hypothetical protein
MVSAGMCHVNNNEKTCEDGNPIKEDHMSLDRREFLFIAASQVAMPVFGDSISVPPQSANDSALLEDKIDWTGFLARQDLLWDRMPANWSEAPFFGNGHFALYLHTESNGKVLRFGIDHTDVFDRRDASWGSPAYSRSRYHVGDFLFTPHGEIESANFRLCLEAACLEGTIATSAGQLHLKVFVHALLDVAVIELVGEGGEPADGWTWRPGDPSSTRPPVRNAEQQHQYQQLYGHPIRIWAPNPPGRQGRSGEMDTYFQELLAGGGYTTAWMHDQIAPSKRRLIVSTAMSWPDLSSQIRAVQNVRRCSAIHFERELAAHRRWWGDYYRRSFVSIPDGQLEAFYWIQMYKYGCAAPKDAGIIDTHGPWLQPTSWPYITWNLNTQISYWALQPANRLDLAESLFKILDREIKTLHANVRPLALQSDAAVLGHCSQQDLVAPLDADVRYEKEWGNLLWICHNYWLQYRFTMESALLRGRFFPLLRSAVNFYLAHLQEGSDARLHLPETYSPETSTTRDCNYDLALLSWACVTLQEITKILHVHDPLLPQWQKITQRLTPFPVDEHGFRIGADLTAQAHRHFSHLLMIYPLHLVTWDDVSQRPLIQKSVDYWLSASAVSGAQTGFTLAVGASMRATMRDGDRVLELLQHLLDSGDGRHKIMPNTMYAESGQNIESPLAAAQAIQDMLLQSWGGILRVFPALPAAWKSTVIHDLRAEGAFLVSARRDDGVTSFIRIRSLAGERCRVLCDLPGEVLAASGGKTQRLMKDGSGVLDVPLERGGEVLLHSKPVTSAVVAACPLAPEDENWFGQHTR